MPLPRRLNTSGKKREIVKCVNQMETKQRDSKWIEVTWLVWPLHINVILIINNFGEKHIQLSVHWSPVCMRDCQLSWRCEYHLTVVLPCVGLLVLSVQKWWNWLLSPIKCVEAIAALCKASDPPPPSPPLCLLQWGSDFWSRDLAVTASDDRGSGEIAPRTPKEAHISGGRMAHSIPTTQRHWSEMMALF